MSDPLADWPDRTPLYDETGAVVLVFSAGETAHERVPWADGVWVPPNVPTARAAELSLAGMAGWQLSTSDRPLAEALLAAGAVKRRHAHTMSRPLTGDLPQATQANGRLQIEPLTPAQVDRHALALGAVHFRAYPPDHPDSLDADEAAAVSQLRAIARGELLGMMLPESRIALCDDEIVGACFVVDRPGEPPHAGPWVIDIFRDPAAPVRGVGTALLGAVVRALAETGLPAVSLAVSHDNAPARRLYLELGLVDADESWTLALPKEDERPGSIDGAASNA